MAPKLSKIIADIAAAFVPGRGLRHRLRDAVDRHSAARVVEYLKASYVPMLSGLHTEKEGERAPLIWQFWAQGEAAAPPLVAACMRSVRKFAGGRTAKIVDETNVADYAKLPDFILEKRAKGIIDDGHFADLLMTYLLAEHGGYFISATTFMTSFVPAHVGKTRFFLFRTPAESGHAGAESFLVHSTPRHWLAEAWRLCLTEYWRRENSAPHPNLAGLMMIAMAEGDRKAAAEFRKIPMLAHARPHALDAHLGDRYFDKPFKRMTEVSFAHELSMGRSTEKALSDPDSFAARILRR
ncbi:MAG: capsular polysaccharide synthesis protein [Rickettsiales bacterium]|jgi:hypothetical protein|nr:capsular polysaccharide synthesis protein [Rickettsiales bacterium]